MDNVTTATASSRSAVPILIHQAIKYGLKAVRKMPVKIDEPYLNLSFDVLSVLICSASFKVRLPKKIKNIPPTAPNNIFTTLIWKNVLNPNAIAKTRGNSTIVWPTAMPKPAFQPFFAPNVIDDAVKGPGANAPEALTPIIFRITAKSSIHPTSFVHVYIFIVD
jgi:hypothetical protein